MGDTFTDIWQDEVPSSIGEEGLQFQYEGCDNSKWEGNYYRYVREVACARWCEERHTITLRSYTPGQFDLRANISLRKPGFEINISSFSGESVDSYDPKTGRWLTPSKEDSPTNREWLPGIKFTSIEECVKAALAKYREILPIFSALQPGPGWEGNT